MSNPRQVALQMLMLVVGQGKSLDAVTESDWYRSLQLESRDIAFARDIASGVCRWYFTLQGIANNYLKKPLRSRDLDIELILMIGLYQLLVLQTGQHAAVNETVKLTAKRKKTWAKGVVNAVLRNVIRAQQKLEDYDVASSYPDWMREQITSDWGPQSAEVLAAGNHRAPMTLRFDSGRLDRGEALQMLGDADIEATPHALVASAITLKNPLAVEQIPRFSQGMFSVQDAAAQLAAPLLDAEPGMRVLDVCAAPGGKALHLAQSVPELELELLDISASRLQRVSQNLQRSGVEATITEGDACSPAAWWSGELYDRILADVPCSASGVIRRHPDIKLLRKRDDVLRLCDSQRKILQASWQMLKPGGIMLYSTCSIFSQENEAQVAAFLESHADSEESMELEVDWGERVSVGYRIAPGRHDMDGFYYARLRKAG